MTDYVRDVFDLPKLLKKIHEFSVPEWFVLTHSNFWRVPELSVILAVARLDISHRKSEFSSTRPILATNPGSKTLRRMSLPIRRSTLSGLWKSGSAYFRSFHMFARPKILFIDQRIISLRCFISKDFVYIQYVMIKLKKRITILG